MSEIIYPYTPTEKQAIAHAAPQKFKLFGGGMGGGKTVWGCQEGVLLSLEYPGNYGVFARSSLKTLKNTTLETFFSEILVPGTPLWDALIESWSATENLLTFRNGSVIACMGLDLSRRDIEMKIKSMNLGWFFIDEASDVDEDIWHMFKTRLRRKPGGKEIRRFGLVSSNPEPGWVKEIFIDQQLPNHTFVQSLKGDNPYLPEDYDSLFENMPDGWKERYLGGDWKKMSGALWECYSEKDHVIDGFPVPADWGRVRVIDHGQHDPTCCLWIAESFEGKFFVYREYYVKGEVASVHARNILSLSEGENIRRTLCDPSMNKRDREFKPDHFSKPIPSSVSDEYKREGLSVDVAENDIIAGINRVNELFKAGMLYIFKDCFNLRRELRKGRWDPDAMPERPIKGEDHATDCLRYYALSRPKVPLKSVPLLRKEGTFWGAKERVKEVRGVRGRRERYGLPLRKLFRNERLSYFNH